MYTKKSRFLTAGLIGASVLAMTASPALAQQPDASRILMDEVRNVVREQPQLADARGDRALLQAVRSAAAEHPQRAAEFAAVAKKLKPALAARIDAAAAVRPAQVTPAAGLSALSVPVPEWAQQPSATQLRTQAREVLLGNVRQVIRENPAYRDGSGDRALLAAVSRSAAQHPELADQIELAAAGLKPHLAPQIAHAVGSGPDSNGVPEWAQLSAAAAPDSSATGAENDIFALGLEDLMNTKVVTASKSQERAFDVPAALTVITNEDIRRSGQTNVMEVLRMVPGMQVSRINSAGWAISARGFADEYANKMLVLVDGRSIYTPTFSGTYWDLVNMPMEDIDRIEVIRGPGASVWGANAVNGVINIVTKEAKYTQGAYISGGMGDHERVFGEGRVGGELGEHGHYRFYSRYLNRDNLESPTGQAQNNGWWRVLTGLRADWSNGGNDDFTVQGEIQHGSNDQELLQLGNASNYSDITMSYLRGRWTRALEDGSVLNVNSYIDQHMRNEPVLEQRVTTFDTDFNHTFRWQGRNETTWGAGYRLMMDDYSASPLISFVPGEEDKSLFNAFVQNKFEATEKLDLTLGTKVEHNDYTGFEVQPTAKAAYHPDARNTLWASVARAVRSPSRTEDSIRYVFGQIPGTPPTIIQGVGNADVESEELVAYEAGYRFSPREGLIFDASAYFNDYDNLTTLTQGAPFFDGSAVIVPLNVHNLGEAEMYGVELSANWQVTPSWLLAGFYAFGHLDAGPGSADQLFLDYETLWPEHTFSIRSLYNINENVEFDTALYYVTDLDDAREVDGSLTPIDAYLKWDVRLGWRPWNGLELSLVGLNLLESGHQEFVDSRFDPASQVGRSYYGKATWRF